MRPGVEKKRFRVSFSNPGRIADKKEISIYLYGFLEKTREEVLGLPRPPSRKYFIL